MSTEYRKKWIITPDRLPMALRKCPRCGGKSGFENSGRVPGERKWAFPGRMADLPVQNLSGHLEYGDLPAGGCGVPGPGRI